MVQDYLQALEKETSNFRFYKNAYWYRFCSTYWYSIMASGDGIVVRAGWCGVEVIVLK